ncbi:glycosyltransferase family 4 protein [Paludisphaera mucosa]|uniref:Glycosyltransferase family 4 protein n=1 Tax=Paludisphaera mucosa TaxID=3030827 RepID=A0ABT6FA62_9BACT|nr:glycosyltransferase family 4 protein [Paludisphaera mucosa]MDG3004467.1 glycosyltransferase family 4 protein [Paludisphaera mucosa]
MRVLMVTSFPIPGQYDGTAMLPIKILRALKPRGVDVVVAHLRLRPPGGLSATREDFEGTPVYTLPPSAWLTGRGLERIAREHPFDVVHAQHYGGATRAYFACRRNRWPMVYEIHSLLGDEVERDRLGRGVVFRAYQALERRVVEHAAWVIALGEPVKDVVVREKGVPADRVSVIYPGIDLGEYERPAPDAPIPGVGPEHKVVMYIGSIVHPNQGVPILIDALPEIFAARPDARCVLVGGPAEAGEEYRRRLGEYGDRLVVLTGTTPEQVVALSRRADVLVHPRLACRENYSVQSKLAVYLAARRPIVATDFGDYQRLLGETGAGVLTAVAPGPLAAGVLKVLDDPDLAASLAAAAGPVAEEYFGMARNVDRYLDVYRRAVTLGPR